MTPESVHGKNVTVVGGARSGVAAARLLTRAGARVFVSDNAAAAERMSTALDDIGVQHEFGGHTGRALDADFFVVSPGVPSRVPILRKAAQHRAPIYSEIEAASWFCKAPIIAITGSNGKTTTTSLLGHVFKTAGRAAIMAGNIGYPFSDYVLDTTPEDLVIAEVSSFQLDHIDTFRPRVSVLLNVTEDHLDRYGNDFEAYTQSKLRIYENQREGDTLIFNADDETLRSHHLPAAAEAQGFTALAFGREEEAQCGAFVREGKLVLRLNHKEQILMERDELSLRGPHNLYNSLAAAVAGSVMNIRRDHIRQSLATFEGVPHRLEFVREIDGVRYGNDSKATNVNAVWYALETFHEPVVLIAGGRDKGNDYTMLRDLVRRKVRVVIGIGESAGKIGEELGVAAGSFSKAASMDDALLQARSLAQRGDVVLLSPACSSFDMFKDYEDRGDSFRRVVNDLDQ